MDLNHHIFAGYWFERVFYGGLSHFEGVLLAQLREGALLCSGVLAHPQKSA